MTDDVSTNACGSTHTYVWADTNGVTGYKMFQHSFDYIIVSLVCLVVSLYTFLQVPQLV